MNLRSFLYLFFTIAAYYVSAAPVLNTRDLGSNIQLLYLDPRWMIPNHLSSSRYLTARASSLIRPELLDDLSRPFQKTGVGNVISSSNTQNLADKVKALGRIALDKVGSIRKVRIRLPTCTTKRALPWSVEGYREICTSWKVSWL
ncbi:hypothetical protein FRC02_003030 [Tulasnella sp. 418]|nr:hypothetical protein FRC02_003030 [Tulasnella sp. 418]